MELKNGRDRFFTISMHSIAHPHGAESISDHLDNAIIKLFIVAFDSGHQWPEIKSHDKCRLHKKVFSFYR